MQHPSLAFFSSMERRDKDSSVERHTHDCFEIVRFDKADGVLTLHHDTYPLQDGSLYLVYPNTPHSEIHRSDAIVSFFGFRCPDFPFRSVSETVFSPFQNEEIGSIMQKIMKEAAEQRPYYDSIISHLLAEILLLLARCTAGNTHPPKNLGYLAAYIAEYCSQPLNLPQLAGEAGYSPDYFRHRFTAEFGMSPKRFQMEARLKKSAELLLRSRKSCTEIAALCGFSSGSQFSSLFFQKYKTTPKQFRQNGSPSTS